MRLQDYIYEKPVLETERLTLRTMTSADTADLKEWLSDNSLYQYWGKHPGKSDLSPEILFTLEKVGFKREGHIRDGKMVNIYCDYYLYGMIKADYLCP